MNCRKLSLALALALTAAFFAAPRAADAQWSSTAIGVAEYDTENTMLLLAGLSAGPGGMGWAPRLGVQGYYLRYDVGSTSVDVTSIRPYVGMRNNFTGGSASISVGYAFTNRDVDAIAGPALVSDHGEGVVLSGGWDYWGTGNAFGYQLLGSYNLGSEAIWTRARGTVPLQIRTDGQTRIGAEVAFLSGKDYSAWQPGALIEFRNGGRIFGLGAGMKFFEGGGDAVYFKGEFVLPLGR